MKIYVMEFIVNKTSSTVRSKNAIQTLLLGGVRNHEVTN